MTHNSQTAATPNVILRHIKSVYDPSTQIVSELGTTDIAIGVTKLQFISSKHFTSPLVIRFNYLCAGRDRGDHDNDAWKNPK